jgi:hypothetical protein
MELDSLIGLKFKRNVHGLSIWEDTIQRVWIAYNMHVNLDTWTPAYHKPTAMVQGSLHSYPLSEIVITGRELNLVETIKLKTMRGRMEMVNKIKDKNK